MRRAQGCGAAGKAAGHTHRRKQQSLGHGGAGSVQAKGGDSLPPEAERRTDTLIEQIAGECQRQLLLCHCRFVERSLQGELLHFRLCLFPCRLSEPCVLAGQIEAVIQRAFPFFFSGDTAESRHRRRLGKTHGLAHGIIAHSGPFPSFFSYYA